MTTVGYFQIAAASWVALLALRGFSLLQIGMLESIFHIVSLCFELPSGIVADVFGRRKTLIASQIASLISGTLMIFSTGFATTALALGCSALSYNLASGTREALAYDSLKQNGDEGFYARFSSTEMMLYRITNSTATLCAGLALWLGYQRAYAIDLFFGLIALGVSFRLVEIKTDETPVHYPVGQEIVSVVQESWQFLVREKKARNIMLVNALIGAVSTLVLFFLQAKLPLTGMNSALLGPALFVMGLGAALGSRMTAYFHKYRYRAEKPTKSRRRSKHCRSSCATENRDIWWGRSDKSQSSCLVMGRQQMRIADSCMKKRKGKREKHSGRSIRSKGMLFRCYKSITDPKNGF